MTYPISRRRLLGTAGALAAPLEIAAQPAKTAPAKEAASSRSVAVDFRYSPLEWQTAYCYPDDPYKSLVDQSGRLLYGNPGRREAEYYSTIVQFTLLGMGDD